MALTLDDIKAARNLQVDADAWQLVREAAWKRIEQVGTPRPRSNEFFFIPLSLFAQINLPKAAKPTATKLPTALTDAWVTALESEKDLASLLPTLLTTAPTLYEIKDNGAWQNVEITSNCPYALHLVTVREKARVRIFWKTSQGIFNAERLDLRAGADSQVEVIVDGFSAKKDSQNLRHSHVHLDAKAKIEWLETDAGTSLTRSSLDAHLAGAKADFSFRALSILEGTSHSHRRLRVTHEAPEVHSEQFIRHVLQGESQASCDTQVEILHGVQGTEAHQLVNSLLLSDHAKVSAKPTLVIHNEDVKASHGTTCGDLDRNQLFYLNSRGLTIGEARRLLLGAFGASLLEAHSESPLRKQLRAGFDQLLALRFA